MYLFKYTWDDDKLKEEDRWTCEDGYVDGVYNSYPDLFWKDVKKDVFDLEELAITEVNVPVDSFHRDIG